MSTPTRDDIAQAIHDGPNAQAQYRNARIAPHSWALCPYQAQYLADADAVLAVMPDRRIAQAEALEEWSSECDDTYIRLAANKRAAVLRAEVSDD